MARRPYGDSAEARAEDAEGNAIPGALFRFYTAKSGGTQYTNLQWADGSAVDSGIVPADSFGYPPAFLSDPSGPGYMWADCGAGTRVRVYANDLADKISSLETTVGGLASDTAIAGILSDLADVEAALAALGPVADTGVFTVHNIKTYGATGDGTTSDSAAIQAALDAANDDGGGIVYCPPGGVYAFTTTLRIYATTTFILPAGATLKRTAAVTCMVNGVTSPVGPGGYGGRSNIVVCGGGTIDMRGAAITGANNCLTMAHAQNITIRDITIKDVPTNHHIELNAVKTARIENVKFLGFTDATGTSTFRECVQLDCAKDAGSTTVPPYDQYMCDDITIQGCFAGASGTSGSTAPNCLVGGHSATVGMRHRGVRVIGNRCDGLLFWAVSGYAITGLVVTGNTFANCAAGVRIDTIDTADTADTLNVAGTQTSASQDERAAVISGNTFLDTGTSSSFHVIAVMGEATGKTLGATVSGNTINGATSGSRGIHCEFTERLNVTGNSIASVNGSGIYIDTCPNSTVTGNSVVSAAGTGIFASATVGISITGNMVLSSGGDAIQVTSSSTDFTVTGNVVRLAATHGINILSGCQDFIVANNTVRGASRTTTNTSSAFRTSGTCTRGTWTGNRARKNGSGNEYANAFSATSSCSVMKRYGNYWQDGVTAGTAVSDASTSQDLVATDTTTA